VLEGSATELPELWSQNTPDLKDLLSERQGMTLVACKAFMACASKHCTRWRLGSFALVAIQHPLIWPVKAPKLTACYLKPNSDDAPSFASLFRQVRTEETFSAGPNQPTPGWSAPFLYMIREELPVTRQVSRPLLLRQLPLREFLRCF
jgi:hypothetical protein